MQTITRDGVRLAYLEKGRGSDTIVLLHGMACVHRDMLPVMDHFADRFRCIALDVRGHGASDKPHSAYDMDTFHADLRFVLHELGVTRPILIGHSFGGSISLAYVDRYPADVGALVMLDSGMRSNSDVVADLGPFYDALRNGTEAEYKAVLDAFVRERLVDPVDGEPFAAAVAAVMTAVPKHVFLSMSDAVQKLQSADMAQRCRIPALFIASRQAFANPTVLAGLPANWHVGRVVGAGHFVQMVVPDQVNAMIDRFFALEGIGGSR